jgi:hypothetical protein
MTEYPSVEAYERDERCRFADLVPSIEILHMASAGITPVYRKVYTFFIGDVPGCSPDIRARDSEKSAVLHLWRTAPATIRPFQPPPSYNTVQCPRHKS